MKLKSLALYWKRRYIPLQRKDAAISCIGNPKNFHCSQIPKTNFDCLPPEKRIELLEHQLALHQAKLQKLKRIIQKFDAIPPSEEPYFSDYLVLGGAVAREETSCHWLKTCIDLCQQRLNDSQKD